MSLEAMFNRGNGLPQAFDAYPSVSVKDAPSPDNFSWSDGPSVAGFHKVDPLDMRPAPTQSVLHAQRGDQMYVRRVIQAKVNNEFMTTIILPLQKVGNVKSIKYDVLEFLPHVAHANPEETAPNLVTSRYQSTEAYLERIGMGAKEEHTSLGTVEGKTVARGKVDSIAKSVSKHLALRGLSALLNTKHMAYQHQLQFGSFSAGGEQRQLAFDELLRHEIELMAVVQKESQLGVRKALHYALMVMGNMNVEPNAVIMTQASDFHAIATEPEKAQLEIPGEKAGQVMTREINVNVIPGLGLMKFVAKPEQVKANGPAIDIMSRGRSNGSWVPQIEEDPLATNYESGDLTIYRYDETNNRWQPIDLGTALQTCRRFDWKAGGRLSNLHDTLVDSLNSGSSLALIGGNEDSFFRGLKERNLASSSSSSDASMLESLDAAISQGINRGKLPDMFVYWVPTPGSSEGRYYRCELLGDIEIPFLSHAHVHSAAATIVNRLQVDQPTREAFWDGIQLLQEIDNAPIQADSAYLKAIAASNVLALKVPVGYYANAAAGGKKENGTPSDNTVPGASLFHTLGLPHVAKDFPTMPLGYANYRGMRYLANVSDTDAKASGWNVQIFARANRFMRAFDVVFDQLYALAPNSPYFFPDFQFHYNATRFTSALDNAKNAFFDHLLKSSGGSIFFASTGTPGAGKDVHGGLDQPESKADQLLGQWGKQTEISIRAISDRIVFSQNAATEQNERKRVATVTNQVFDFLQGPLGARPDKLVEFVKTNILDPIDAEAGANGKISFDGYRQILAQATTVATVQQAEAASMSSVWVATPLTHPAHQKFFLADTYSSSDMDSIHFLKPISADHLDRANALGKSYMSQFHSSTPQAAFGGVRQLLRTGVQATTSARDPLRLPLHTAHLADSTGDRFRAAEKMAATDADSFSSSSGLGFPTASDMRRTAASTAGRASSMGLTEYGFSDEQEDGKYPFWGKEARDSKLSNQDLRQPQGGRLTAPDSSIFASPNMRLRFRAAETVANPLERIAAHVYASLPLNGATLMDLVKNNVRIPMNFFHATPNQRRKTHSWIVCVAGSSTGITAWNHAIWEKGDDVRTQVRWMSFTVYVACVVHNDSNVMILRDVFLSAYLSGNGDTFITERDDFNRMTGQHKGDIMTFAIPATETRIPEIMSIRGTFQAGAVPRELHSRMNKDQKLHFSTALFYNLLYGENVTEYNPMVGAFHANLLFNNTICVRGGYQKFDRKSRQWMEVDNMGHCGPDRVGAKALRAGSTSAWPLVFSETNRREIRINGNR